MTGAELLAAHLALPVPPRQYAGGSWLQQVGTPVSPFGLRVGDLLGEWQRGIYHLERNLKSKKTDFSGERYVSLRYDWRGLATVDAGDLTRLVFLAHDYHIRVSIAPMTFHYLLLEFWPRLPEGAYSQRQPTLERAVAAHRADHPLPEVTP